MTNINISAVVRSGYFIVIASVCALAQTYRDDSLAVRTILDANGLTGASVEEVTNADDGRITELDLESQNLTVFPASIGNLTALENLNLAHNDMPSVPEIIGTLTSLAILDLSKNNLSVYPTAVLNNLTRLTNLNLQRNNLTILPPDSGYVLR